MASKKKVKVYKKKKHTPESKLIEELLSRYNTIDVTKTNKFSDLPLSKRTLKGLTENNYIEMTDIQKKSIGLALQGNDILGAAKTGSGKTLAFLIPILEILYCKQWTKLDGLGVLIITPTRELAYQIYETLRKVGQHHDISAGLIIGGKDLKFEKKRMDQCNIIICTPGRLLQHMDENPLFDCVNMQVLILDEADRCLDMGFEKTMNSIIENLPSKRQTLLFSATQTKSMKDLVRLSLKDPTYVFVHEHSTHTTPENLQQSYIICSLEDKTAMLWSFIRNHLKQKIIVFFSSCKQVKYMFEAFCRLRPGISLLALYGTLHQLRRMDIYTSFCKKQHAILFATDIAARGLDFPAVNWVVQMDCPEDVNAYIHRAGRTARFNNGGESLLVLLPSEEVMVEKIQQHKIPINMIEINPNKLHSPHRKLQMLLARDLALKETAQRAFVAYIKSVFLMKDKKVFNVNSLNTDAYASSLGILIPPRIRFLQRMQKKILANNTVENNKNKEQISDDMISCNKQDGNENSTDVSDVADIEENEKESIKENTTTLNNTSALQFNDNDDNADIFSLKTKNIIMDDMSITENNDIDKTLNKNKVFTNATMVKTILKTKVAVNKKIVFDDEGQEVTDFNETKILQLVQQHENKIDSVMNIEILKQTLHEEDQINKEKFKEKIKKKHREQKRKHKAPKKTDASDKEDDNASNDEGKDAKDDSEDESSEGPDISWLPDPDKIYGKEENMDAKISSSNDSEEDEESIEENKIRFKRKLMTQEEHKTRKKLKTANTIHLQADEELALQLLQN